ncbi:MAG: HIT domain-containing protein [Erysipelotrichaceae bacterium]
MCIFCKIINHEIPGSILYEDEDVIAFLDISQVTKGHTLILSKKHTENFNSVDTEILVKMIKVSQMLSIHLVKQLHAKGMNILSNMNEIAGQSVPHFHIHLIPRYQDDDAIEITFHQSEPQDLDALQALLRID